MFRTNDDTEREFWKAVHRSAADVWDTLMTNLARKIVNEYHEAKKRGQKSG